MFIISTPSVILLLIELNSSIFLLFISNVWLPFQCVQPLALVQQGMVTVSVAQTSEPVSEHPALQGRPLGPKVGGHGHPGS